jgi:hypothetical protein
MAEDEKEEGKEHEFKKIVIHDEVFYYDTSEKYLDLAVDKLKWSSDYNSKEKIEELKETAYKDTSKHRAPFEAKDHHFKITYRNGRFEIERDQF